MVIKKMEKEKCLCEEIIYRIGLVIIIMIIIFGSPIALPIIWNKFIEMNLQYIVFPLGFITLIGELIIFIKKKKVRTTAQQEFIKTTVKVLNKNKKVRTTR